MAALGNLPPDIEPRATEYIPQMIAMIERLIASGHAYAAEGHVLFRVASYPHYGQLSRRSRDDMIAGARVEVAPYKRDPGDFVLWKPSEPGQPGWDSPWGRGRPGWHIECSAMSETHLGETFDIHGGGLDLVFPHHENEIAQSVCAHGGRPFVRYWMHNGMLTDGGAKMSKSLGNFLTVRELLAEAPGEAIRLALLGTHYRDPLDWTSERLRQARQTLDRFYRALTLPRDAVFERFGEADAALRPVREALEDDLNTPLALTHLHELAGAINRDELGRRALGPAERRSKRGGQLMGLLEPDPLDVASGQRHSRCRVDRAEDRCADGGAAPAPLRRGRPHPRRTRRRGRHARRSAGRHDDLVAEGLRVAGTDHRRQAVTAGPAIILVRAAARREYRHRGPRDDELRPRRSALGAAARRLAVRQGDRGSERRRRGAGEGAALPDITAANPDIVHVYAATARDRGMVRREVTPRHAAPRCAAGSTWARPAASSSGRSAPASSMMTWRSPTRC